MFLVLAWLYADRTGNPLATVLLYPSNAEMLIDGWQLSSHLNQRINHPGEVKSILCKGNLDLVKFRNPSTGQSSRNE